MKSEPVTLYELSAPLLSGEAVSLSEFAGRVLLIVNTASKCGFTPQYGGLEQLYRTYAERGFSVLGFPCNQFGGQEPGPESEILAYCTATYGVTFPLFAKIDVNGPTTHPIYQHLKSAKRGFLGRRTIAWNFTKFLLDREGAVVARYASWTKPSAIERHIVPLLAKP